MNQKKTKSYTLSPIGLNPNLIGFDGLATIRELDDMTALFQENLQSFYSTINMVSHEGNYDFAIYFAALDPITTTFRADIVIILSYSTILHFLKFIEDLVEPFESESAKEAMADSTNEVNISKDKQLRGMIVSNKTKYLAPNSYFGVSAGTDYQLYFGRRIGSKDGKRLSIFNYSVIIPKKVLVSTIEIIKINIATFEKNNGLKIEDLVPKVIKDKL